MSEQVSGETWVKWHVEELPEPKEGEKGYSASMREQMVRLVFNGTDRCLMFREYATSIVADHERARVLPGVVEALKGVGVGECWCAPNDRTDWRNVGSASDPNGHSPSCRQAKAAVAAAESVDGTR